MEKKFKILHILGAIWKILAWIALVVGLLSSVGLLLMSIFGGEMVRQFIPPEQMPWSPRLFGVAGGIVTFVTSFVFLLLAIEENTRLMTHAVRPRPAPQAPPIARPSRPTPLPPPPPVPQPPPPGQQL
jgi:hypothetical protein